MTILKRIARVGAVSGIAMTAAAWGCANKQPPPRAEAVPVSVGTVGRQDVPLEVRANGHVDPYSTVAIKARVGGQVTHVGFREGQNVHKGDVLFQIDSRPYGSALAQAEAQLERDRAIAKNAQQEVQRYGQLVAKDYVTREQYDLAGSNAAAMVGTVKADEAAVENARLNLSYCTVAAPMSARTGAVLLYPGNMVKGNDDNPLVVLNQIQPVYVSFSVPESSLALIRQHSRPGQTLKVIALTSGSSANNQTGDLTFLNNTVDPTTGTILLKATFPNQNEVLWPGEYVDVTLRLATEPNAIVVPTQAIQTGQSGQYVYVVKNDLTVESRPVSMNRTQGPLSIVAKGLQPGERVVTDGQLRLAPGAKVEIKQTQGRTS